MHPIRCGPCDCSYPEGAGVFYAKGMKAGEYVSYVAEHYPVVEVDSTFYRSPSRRHRAPVVAFVNNHFAGFAPETLRQLAALLAP